MSELRVLAPDGLGEVGAGDDLAELLCGLVLLQDGDVVVVTSKVVSKAEGRVVAGTRDQALPAETARVVARRGATQIVRTHGGITLAAAGIDASNVTPGHVVLLPTDPDGSARRLRDRLRELSGCTVGVIVSDTAGRAWREGQSDIAVGAAGVVVLEDHTGREDGYGNDLAVTAPAVADELAAAADLVQGKLGRRPFAVLRGRADLVLPAGDHGPGAAALVRPEESDMFGLGAREAVVRALVGDERDRAAFGAPATPDDLAAAVTEVTGSAPRAVGVGLVSGGDPRLLRALAHAHGWLADPPDPTDASGLTRLRPPSP